MASLEHTDLLLGEALEYIIEASNEIREMDVINHQENLMRIARAVSELWKIRNTIYRIEPDMKRDFIREREQDRKRYEELHDIQERAYKAEISSDIGSAMNLYEELRTTSRFGYFRVIAEAGLYRLWRHKTAGGTGNELPVCGAQEARRQ